MNEQLSGKKLKECEKNKQSDNNATLYCDNNLCNRGGIGEGWVITKNVGGSGGINKELEWFVTEIRGRTRDYKYQ